MRYNLVCPRFIFIHYLQSTKIPKNSLIFRCPITHCALQFHFQFCFVEFVSVVESSCWFDCVRQHSSFAPLLFLVSAAMLSTVSKQQVKATTLLDLPPLATMCDLSLPR